MKKSRIFLLAVIAMAITACNDDSSSSSCPSFCSNGCDKNGLCLPVPCVLTAADCLPTQSVDASNCRCVDNSSACTLTAASCTATQTFDALNCRCVDNSSACTLTAASCTATQTFDASNCRCVDNSSACTLTAANCGVNQTFDASNCRCVDNSSACTLTAANCGVNQTFDASNCRCVDNIVNKCSKDECADKHSLNKCNVDTGTVTNVSCPYGCENDACLGASVLLGEPCLDTSVPLCDGNTLIMCGGDGVWTSFSCPNGYGCEYVDNWAYCLEKCTNSGTKSSSCGGDSVYGSVQLDTVCTKTGNGMFYIPDNSSAEPCSYGCADQHVCQNSPCILGEYKETCSGKSNYTMCSNDGTVMSGACADNKTCIYRPTGLSYCGLTCDPATAKTKICWPSPDGTEWAYANVECREGDSGHYGYDLLGFVMGCSGGCDDEKGCIE